MVPLWAFPCHPKEHTCVMGSPFHHSPVLWCGKLHYVISLSSSNSTHYLPLPLWMLVRINICKELCKHKLLLSLCKHSTNSSPKDAADLDSKIDANTFCISTLEVSLSLLFPFFFSELTQSCSPLHHIHTHSSLDSWTWRTTHLCMSNFNIY